MDEETRISIVNDLEEISESVVAYQIHEKVEKLVERTVPLLLNEVARFQELQNLVYRLMFVQMEEEENKTLQGELVQFFRNQVQWPDDDDETDSSEESEETNT